MPLVNIGNPAAGHSRNVRISFGPRTCNVREIRGSRSPNSRIVAKPVSRENLMANTPDSSPVATAQLHSGCWFSQCSICASLEVASCRSGCDTAKRLLCTSGKIFHPRIPANDSSEFIGLLLKGVAIQVEFFGVFLCPRCQKPG